MNATYTGKRSFDLLILAVSAPITIPLGFIAAAAVRLTDGPPVLFRQRRTGLHGIDFDVLKFRTMNAKRSDDGALLPDRDRLTRIGRVLRKTSLDELPQLLNILRGEMSLVGPRPLYPRYVPHYTAREATRHTAIPGITGLAQVSGRNAAGWRDRLELDAQYAEHPTFLRDIMICFQTALKVIQSDGVSVIAGESGDPLDVERSHPSKDGLQLRRLYPRDLALRVKWMSNSQIREHMNLPENVTIESTERWYADTLRDSNRHEFAVENGRGQVLAMTGLRASYSGGPSEFYVFVAPESHGRGIGQIATELTIEQAVRIGTIPSVTLTVAKANSRAVHIYENLGFQITSSDVSRLWMALNLEDKSVSG